MNFFNRGGDCHVATDGNFNHRHRQSAGDNLPSQDTPYFLPKAFVDAVGDRIESRRKRPAKSYIRKVPDEAVDDCENAHEAASDKKRHSSTEVFDDTGVMALVCRHDIPLFFANIDTPGEQQKYAVALFEHLFSLLPLQATVVGLYDIGCVLDRSLYMVRCHFLRVVFINSEVPQYDILPSSTRERLMFATSAMHAYAHQWSCQLIYNPRLRTGLGLTDGEGVERIWSRLRKLIGIERTSSVGHFPH